MAVLAPLLAALLPVLLALVVAGFASSTRGSWAGLARSLALGVALAVVLGELLPHVAARQGALALGLFLLGLWGPAALEDLGRRLRALRPGPGGPGLVLLGLCAHQLVDGAAVGGAWAHGEGPAVALAVAVHSLPLITATLQAVMRRASRGMVLLGSLGLLLGTGLGVLAGHLGVAQVELLHDWLPPFLAGLVLHVLAHDLHAAPAEGARARWSELALLLGGGLLTLLVVGGEGRHAHNVDASAAGFEALALDSSLAVAAPVLLGLALLSLPQLSRRLPRALDPVAAILALALLGPGLALPAVLGGAALAGLVALGQPVAARSQGARRWLVEDGPWLLAGTLGMAMVEGFVAPLPTTPALAEGAGVVVVLACLVLPLRPVAAVPLLVALQGRGLPDAAVAAALLLVLAGCARHPLAPRLQGLLVAALAGLLALFLPVGPRLVLPHLAAVASLSALLLLLLATMGRVGPRSWLAALELASHAHGAEAGGPGDTGHHHGHGHGHHHGH